MSKRRCIDFVSMLKKIMDIDEDFEDLPPQLQSKKLKNKDAVRMKCHDQGVPLDVT